MEVKQMGFDGAGFGGFSWIWIIILFLLFGGGII
jgi:hypothetical protein